MRLESQPGAAKSLPLPKPFGSRYISSNTSIYSTMRCVSLTFGISRSPLLRIATSFLYCIFALSRPPTHSRRNTSCLRRPIPGMSLTTLNDIFYAIVERNHERVMMHRPVLQWLPVSSQELYRNVAGVARTLAEWGLAKGDRVAILSENRPEWTIADFACQLLGLVSVPIYSTLTAEQCSFILQDAGVRVVFVSSEQQLRKVQAVLSQTHRGKDCGDGSGRDGPCVSHGTADA